MVCGCVSEESAPEVVFTVGVPFGEYVDEAFVYMVGGYEEVEVFAVFDGFDVDVGSYIGSSEGVGVW